MRGLYVHIPFCVKKCSYCDFYSLPARLDTMESYIQAVLQEAESYAKNGLSPSDNGSCHSEATKCLKNLVSDPQNTRCIRPSAEGLSMTSSDSATKRDLQPLKNPSSNLSFQTIYFGGGTPSLLGAKHLKSLINGLEKVFKLGCRRFEPSAEAVRKCRPESATVPEGSPCVSQGDSSGTSYPQKDIAALDMVEATIEVNPESATREFLEAAKDTGFSRISFGVQSLSDDELKSVGRIHTAAQAISAIKLAKKIDFKAISADLIIGLPGQTWTSLHKSLETMVGLGIQHLSVYCLSLEEGTSLANSPPTNLPSDDMQVRLFEETKNYLNICGYAHYEISNFAIKGYECLHNLNYWRGGEYLGLGPAAASHLDGKRFKNYANLDAYLENPIGQGEYIEELSKQDKAAEEAMLRLRLLEEGLNTDELASKFGDENVKGIIGRLDEMAQEGLLIAEGSRYRLTPSRIMTSNPIFARVIAVMSE